MKSPLQSLNKIYDSKHICEICSLDAHSCECPGAYLPDGSFQPSLDATNQRVTHTHAAVICDPQGRVRLKFMSMTEAMHELAHFPLNWSAKSLSTNNVYRNERLNVIRQY